MASVMPFFRVVSFAVATLLATAGVPAGAATVSDPFVRVLVDGQEVSASLTVRPVDPDAKVSRFEGRSAIDDVFSLDFSGTFDTDPFISWSFTLNHSFNDAPIGITITFGIPTVGGPYNEVRNFFSGQLTDTRGGGVSATGLQNRVYLDGVLVPGSAIGEDCIYSNTAANSVSPCPPAPATQYGEKVTAVPSALYTSMWTETAFTLSGRDIATFTGTTTLGVAEVPEPATLVLVVAGLALLAGMRRLS
jgi:hypothetical protein